MSWAAAIGALAIAFALAPEWVIGIGLWLASVFG